MKKGYFMLRDKNVVLLVLPTTVNIILIILKIEQKLYQVFNIQEKNKRPIALLFFREIAYVECCFYVLLFACFKRYHNFFLATKKNESISFSDVFTDVRSKGQFLLF